MNVTFTYEKNDLFDLINLEELLGMIRNDNFIRASVTANGGVVSVNGKTARSVLVYTKEELFDQNKLEELLDVVKSDEVVEVSVTMDEKIVYVRRGRDGSVTTVSNMVNPVKRQLLCENLEATKINDLEAIYNKREESRKPAETSEFVSDETNSEVPVKRGRGRPKGSKNKKPTYYGDDVNAIPSSYFNVASV